MQLTRRDTTLTLVGIVMALFLGALDQTIVATALPAVVEDLQGVSRYAWVATAYILASTALVPVYGKLADVYARKHIELFAVATFLLGSFLSGAAGVWGPLPLIGDGMNQLIAFRALQGIGGAGLFAMAFIVIADLFPPRERGKYQGLVGAAFALASLIGPWLGGLLADNAGGWIPGVAGWRWVFYVNLPIGALALWFIATRMPPLRPQGGQRLDVLAALLLILTLVPLVLGLQLDRSQLPWTHPLTLALFGAALVFAALFVRRSLRSDDPVLDLRLFRSRLFTLANLAAFLLGAVFLSVIIFLPLYLVTVVGVSATQAGVALIPLSLGVSFGSIGAGQLAARLGRYKPILLGAALVLLGAAGLLATLGVESPYARVVWTMVLFGLGIGPGLPLYTLAIQNATEPRRLGQATSAAQFFRQIGGAVGTALMGSMLAAGLALGIAQLPDLPAGVIDPARFAGEGALATAQLRPQLEAALGSEGAALADTLEEAVRGVFAETLSRIFGTLFWVAAAAALVTLFLPDMQLRAGRSRGETGRDPGETAAA